MSSRLAGRLPLMELVHDWSNPAIQFAVVSAFRGLCGMAHNAQSTLLC
jgi:hypothetical protein